MRFLVETNQGSSYGVKKWSVHVEYITVAGNLNTDFVLTVNV